MKNVIYVAVAVVVALASNAGAVQGKSVRGKKASNVRSLKKVSTTSIKTRAAVAKKAKAKQGVVAAPSKIQTPYYAPTSTLPQTSYGSGKSTIAAPVAASAAPANRFSAKIVDRASVPMGLANGQYDGRVSSDEQDIQAAGTMNLRLGYKLTDNASVGLGTDADHSYGALNNGKAVWIPYDVFASISHSKLTTLPGEIGVKGSFRFYAPTSEGSQAAGQIARLRANLTLNRQFGAVNLLYSADPQYYIQEYLTATTVNESGSEDHSGTRSFRLYHYAGVEVEMTPSFGAYSYLGLDQGWYNDDPNFKLKKNTKPTAGIYAETGLTYKVSDNISLAGGVVQDSNPDMLAQQPNKEGPLYRDEFSAYFLEGTLSF